MDDHIENQAIRDQRNNRYKKHGSEIKHQAVNGMFIQLSAAGSRFSQCPQLNPKNMGMIEFLARMGHLVRTVVPASYPSVSAVTTR